VITIEGSLICWGGMKISDTVITSWVIIAVLTILSYVATRNMKDVPGPLQNAAEMVVEKLREYYSNILGEKVTRENFALLASFFIFIIVSNYSGLLPGAGKIKGFFVPTASLSVTVGLALMASYTTHHVGVKTLGAKKYLKSFFGASLIMIPLTLIEQIVRPLSLSLRLYGNLHGEETVNEQLFELFPVLLPLLIQVLSLLFCAIQAIIFTMLVSLYIAEGIEHE